MSNHHHHKKNFFVKIPRMKLQTEAKTEGPVDPSVFIANFKINEAEFIRLMASYTFHVDFESPVFADLSISCNNPGENFSTQKLNEIIKSESNWS